MNYYKSNHVEPKFSAKSVGKTSSGSYADNKRSAKKLDSARGRPGTIYSNVKKQDSRLS